MVISAARPFPGKAPVLSSVGVAKTEPKSPERCLERPEAALLPEAPSSWGLASLASFGTSHKVASTAVLFALSFGLKAQGTMETTASQAEQLDDLVFNVVAGLLAATLAVGVGLLIRQKVRSNTKLSPEDLDRLRTSLKGRAKVEASEEEARRAARIARRNAAERKRS